MREWLLALWNRIDPREDIGAVNPPMMCRLYIEGTSIAGLARLYRCSERTAMRAVLDAFPYVYKPADEFELFPYVVPPPPLPASVVGNPLAIASLYPSTRRTTENANG